MRGPWASVVLPVQAMAVARVPMVRVPMAAVAVRQARASRPSLRVWSAATVVPVVSVAMRRVRARPATVVLVAMPATVTTV
jgi:hypothetical protein